MKHASRFFKPLFACQYLALLAIGQSWADNRVNSGAFMTTAAGTSAGYTITGTAVMARDGDSVTFITTHVMGLKPNVKYGSHVHNLPCSMGAGAHYKTNPLIDSAVADNEIWPLLQSDSMGMASAFISKPFRVRPEGQSIVIHDTTAAKGKIACADLMESTMGPVTNSGDFQRFPDTMTTLAGSATMVRNGDTTRVSVMVSGLLPNTAYGCHVHNLPGALQKGGGHYLIDPAVTTVIEANEIWLNFTTDSSGSASKTVTSMTMARPEAQSIVIHAPGGTRIGWADLMPSMSTSLEPRRSSRGCWRPRRREPRRVMPTCMGWASWCARTI